MNINFILIGDLSLLETLLKYAAIDVPLVTLFLLIIIYMVWDNNKKDAAYKKEIEKKDNTITKLNDYIRESDKENMKVLNEVNNTLDKVLENQEESNVNVIKEINNLKEWFTIKYKNLT